MTYSNVAATNIQNMDKKLISMVLFGGAAFRRLAILEIDQEKPTTLQNFYYEEVKYMRFDGAALKRQPNGPTREESSSLYSIAKGTKKGFSRKKKAKILGDYGGKKVDHNKRRSDPKKKGKKGKMAACKENILANSLRLNKRRLRFQIPALCCFPYFHFQILHFLFIFSQISKNLGFLA